MNLKFYEREWRVYADYWKVNYTPKEALKIGNKLAKHFKIKYVQFRFTSNQNGYANYWGRITLPKQNIALAMICHELGHILSVKKYGSKGKGHNKWLKKANKQIYRYAIKYLPIEILLGIRTQKLLENKS